MYQQYIPRIIEELQCSNARRMHGSGHRTLVTGARNQLKEVNYRSYLKHCLLNSPLIENQDLLNSVATHELKSTSSLFFSAQRKTLKMSFRFLSSRFNMLTLWRFPHRCFLHAYFAPPAESQVAKYMTSLWKNDQRLEALQNRLAPGI